MNIIHQGENTTEGARKESCEERNKRGRECKKQRPREMAETEGKKQVSENWILDGKNRSELRGGQLQLWIIQHL